MERERRLTDAGMDMYKDRCQRYSRQFTLIQRDIETLICAIKEHPDISDIDSVYNQLDQSCSDFEKLSYYYIDFLTKTRTTESAADKRAHLQFRDHIKMSVAQVLSQRTYIDRKQSSVDRESLKSGSSRFSHSSTKSVILQKRAELEATKAKMKYAEKQAEMLRQKVALEAEINLMQVKQEAEALESAIKVMESADLLEDRDAESVSKARHERTSEFVQKHFENITNPVNTASIQHASDLSEIQPASSQHFKAANVTCKATPIYLPEQPTEFTYVKGPRQCVTVSETMQTYQIPVQSTPQFLGQPTRPSGYFDLKTENQSLPTVVHSSPLSANLFQDTLGHGLASGITTTSGLVSQQYCPVTSQVSVTQSANHGTPIVSSNNNNSQIELCQLMTKMMARKDVVLSRLIKYNDSPVQYLSWKQTFKDVMSELSVTPSEELDLMIKWLGPDSCRQAESMKTASAGNHIEALRKVWDRLDVRYGSPELIEACLKNKLANFPKLSNTATDSKRLYDLYDILSEIQCVKANPHYSTVLALYDSSSGVNQVVSRLPYNLQEKWSTLANNYKKQHNMLFPPFSFFVNFIYDMAKWRTDPSFHYTINAPNVKTSTHNQPQMRVSAKKTELSSSASLSDKPTCPIHGTNHDLNQCRAFRQKPLEERYEILKKHKLCFRCCSLKKHVQKRCKETIHCDLCKRTDHPTGLHVSKNQEQSKDSTVKNVNLSQANKGHGGEPQTTIESSCTQVCGDSRSFSKSCAKILQVYLYRESRPDEARKVYALIDDQSNHTLGTPHLFDSFNDSLGHINFTLSTCSGKVSVTGRKTEACVVEAIDHSISIKIPSLIECADIPNNRNEIPSPEVVKNFPHLRDLSAYIPPVDDNVHIELLIGRDVLLAHHVLEQRLGGDSLPYAHKLHLGWVVVGESCMRNTHHGDTINVNKTNILSNGRTTHMEPCVNVFAVKQSTIFERTPHDERLGPSVEDRLFLDLMDSTVTKDSDNHWTAPLPFRENRRRLPNNKTLAVQRVHSLDRSLQKDEIKKKQVLDFMDNMLQNGHAEIAPPLPIGSECWYLPFFGVYHPKKPDKVRVVFDSSAVFAGTSLNDVLMKGPDMTNSLLGVLLRFRKEAVAITADVQQMFYNFKVDELHRNFLRFVWHENNDISRPLTDFRMTVHVFGNSPSPSVATFCLRKSVENADEDVREFVCNNFYVDDGLTSFTDSDLAVDLVKRTQKALEVGGGIRLHKIVSNSTSVLQRFPQDDLSSDLKDLDLGSETPPIQRSLGMSWDISDDRFVFKVSPETKPFTRRGALSVINSLFDPVGFASPVTMYGKLLLREMMSVSGPVDWDEELPSQLKCKWEQWVSSLVHLQNLRIPRKYSDISYREALHKEVHIFSDASRDAIASVAYLKLMSENQCDVSFLLGKAKVSPVHGHTIPRPELCAAVLSIELADLVKEHLDIPSSDFHYYTDSKVVLGYLSNDVRRFYVYVTNRVNRIRAASSPSQWSFISTDKNPADIATRRMDAADLVNSVYLTGPDFLRFDTKVASCEYPLVDPNEDKEVRREVSVHKTETIDHIDYTLSNRFSHFSSWNSLVRALMFLKGRIRKLHNESKPTRLDVEQFIVRVVQKEAYATELESLQTGNFLSRKSSILPLAPVLDHNGILRVGGRLKRAKTIPQNLQPIIIPRNNHVANLLVRHYHSIVHHQGRHMTEGALRSSGYWVIGSKRLVSAIISRCVICLKSRGKFRIQQMSDLPEDRVSPGPPFTFVGLDTFGPWSVLHRKTRGCLAQQKRWTILFTCLVSRAIHLEVVDEMSSAAFINAFRRFVAIRGPVKLLRSDRGTNFVGAVQDLGIEAEFVENGTVSKTLETCGTTWKFNPPHSSHFGGSWERMIGICRRVLDDMLIQEKHKLTHDSLVTLMAEVSAIVNSRPLLPISTDPENPEVLSPSVLLTHKKGQNDITSLPQFGIKDMLRSQWKLVQGLADEFWSRWTKEYISTLQVRRKWTQKETSLNVGDIVLLREKEAHRSVWPMAVVTKLFPSSHDSLVRKVEIRLTRENKTCTLVRPVVELVPLVLVDDN